MKITRIAVWHLSGLASYPEVNANAKVPASTEQDNSSSVSTGEMSQAAESNTAVTNTVDKQHCQTTKSWTCGINV